MSDQSVDRGVTLLAQISNEIVHAQKEYWGKGPDGAKSYMFDDMLFVVMRGGVDDGRELDARVRRGRPRPPVPADVREPDDGQDDRHHRAAHGPDGPDLPVADHVRPDRVVEMFVFDDTASDHARAATAEGEASDGLIGEATVDLAGSERGDLRPGPGG
jgi:hypothetical protein